MPRAGDPDSSDGADSLFDAKPKPPAVPEKPSRRGGVLVVEDAPLFRAKARAILAAWRYPLIEAEDGQVALEAAQKLAPRLILLDIHLPGMDGLQVLERLDADDDLRRIPVVVLTADAQSTTVRRALRGHADDYLLKTSDAQEIRERLAKHLGPLPPRRPQPSPASGAASEGATPPASGPPASDADPST